MTRASILALLAWQALFATAYAADRTPVPAESSHAAIERGRNLVHAGDCEACHTDDGGKQFAGGRAVPTPFGIIYSTNITPDKSTGIGTWSADDVYRALHRGVDRKGRHLYPAFPYPWYTKLTRQDSDAIKAYLDTLAPVNQPDRANELPWPLSLRIDMAVWNALFFTEGTYQSNPQKSVEWNQGAYLVEGAGHCGACHSPKNFAGAVKHGRPLSGGYGEDWYAVALTGDTREGLGNWSIADIVDFLKTGANARASAFGPMAEVVRNSTSHLTDAQLHAIAVYLKDFAPAQAAAQPAKPAQDAVLRGAGVYRDQCAGCHMTRGEGLASVFPPLQGNQVVQSGDPETLLHLVLAGEKSAVTHARPAGFAMPAFDWKLDDGEIADLASYVRSAWGNEASPVAASTVASIRHKVQHLQQ